MKYNNYILLGIAFTALPVSIQAQTQPKDTTVNRTVIVEQQYNPDIMDAAKVNVLPKVEEPSVSKKEALTHFLICSFTDSCKKSEKRKLSCQTLQDIPN